MSNRHDATCPTCKGPMKLDTYIPPVGKIAGMAIYACPKCDRVDAQEVGPTPHRPSSTPKSFWPPAATGGHKLQANQPMLMQSGSSRNGTNDSDIPAADSRIVEALLEMPRALSGIPSDVFDRVLDELISRTHPTESAALNEQEAALDVMRAGIRAVDSGLREATGLAMPSEFAKWFTEATKDTKPDVQDTAVDVEGLATDAAKLPLNARMTLVDRLLKHNTDEVVGAAA